VTFNCVWIAIWVLSAIGLHYNFRLSYFPIWLLAVAGIGNLIAHPLLAILNMGYFPGLFTSPLVGIIGVVLSVRLYQLTE
jgi:hypothetical protein